LRVVSRAGDRARVLIAGRAAEPIRSINGWSSLDTTTLVGDPIDCVCGPDGVGVVTFDEALSGTGWAQALVLPRGLSTSEVGYALWSDPLEVELP